MAMAMAKRYGPEPWVGVGSGLTCCPSISRPCLLPVAPLPGAFAFRGKAVVYPLPIYATVALRFIADAAGIAAGIPTADDIDTLRAARLLTGSGFLRLQRERVGSLCHPSFRCTLSRLLAGAP